LALVDPAAGAVEEPMKCVWSGYPDYERDCRSRIPASVVVKAWQREMQLEGTQEGFFHFAWRNGVWLAFGAQDGSVRGVYCPTHCSERESRGVQVQDRRAGQQEAELSRSGRRDTERASVEPQVAYRSERITLQ
jgi:hypothetical protein